MFSWFGGEKKKAGAAVRSAELAPAFPARVPGPTPAELKEHKAENKEHKDEAGVGAAVPASELNIFDNLKSSVRKLEVQLRQQLETILDPDIYRDFILNGRKDETGRRYQVVTRNKDDLLFYYQHVLNLLMDFQEVMGPVSSLHKEVLTLLKHTGKWSKGKQIWSKSGMLNVTINSFGDYYGYFLASFRELELDTVLGRLPAFQDLKAWVKLLGPVQTTAGQFTKNPFVDSYNTHANHWRGLLGLQPAQLPLDQVEGDEEDDEGYGEEKEDKVEVRAEEAPAVDEAKQAEVRTPWAQQGALRMLQDLPHKMNAIKTALKQILRDLTGTEVSASVRKDYENTIDLTSKILRKLKKFSKKTSSWKNLVSFAYDIYPLVRDLLASLPQSYVSLNKILREHLMTTVRQLNLIVRDWFLFADQVEGQFYLKDGLLLSLAERKNNCGLFMVRENPRTPAAQTQLDKMLGDMKQAYILHGTEFYYVNRYLSKQTGRPGINVKRLHFRKRGAVQTGADGQASFKPVLDAQGRPLCFTVSQLRESLGAPRFVMFSPEGYRCIHPGLKPHQLDLIGGMTTPRGRATGRYREPGLYEQHDFSMMGFAREFNAWAERLGYEFLETERYPYTRDFIDQRRRLLDAERKAAQEQKESSPRMPYKEVLLVKRLAAKTRFLAEEKALEEKNKRAHAQELLDYKQGLIRAQIDKRIAELNAEKEARWIKFSNTKENKIALLERLKAGFKANPSFSCQEVMLSLSLDEAAKNLLEEGRTGKVVQTLRLVTSTPADRDQLVDLELARLRQEQAREYWFFAERRRNHLAQRLAALREFRQLLKPGYRVQEILDYISAKQPEKFAILKNESKLLSQLKEIDRFTPNAVLGKRAVDFGGLRFGDLRAASMPAREPVARQPASLEEKSAEHQPHFFRLSQPLGIAAAGDMPAELKRSARLVAGHLVFENPAAPPAPPLAPRS